MELLWNTTCFLFWVGLAFVLCFSLLFNAWTCWRWRKSGGARLVASGSAGHRHRRRPALTQRGRHHPLPQVSVDDHSDDGEHDDEEHGEEHDETHLLAAAATRTSPSPPPPSVSGTVRVSSSSVAVRSVVRAKSGGGRMQPHAPPTLGQSHAGIAVTIATTMRPGADRETSGT